MGLRFLFLIIFLTACAHNSIHGGSSKLAKIDLNYPLDIKVIGEKGYVEKMRHFSYTIQKKYVNGYISSEKQETAIFTVKSEIKNINPEQNLIEYDTVTTEKIGVLDLNDLAFPNLNEHMQVILNDKGKILKAGDYPPFSIFYLPPLPLPERPVRVGDTWAYKGSWINPGQGIEFNIDLVMILKETYSCLDKEICIKVEVAGNVYMPKKLQKIMDLTSRIKGQVLYRPRTGSFLFAEIHNDESLKISQEKVDSKSCIISKMIDFYPQTEIENLKCEP